MSNTINLFPLKIYKTRYEKASEFKDTVFSKLDYAWGPADKDNQYFMRDGTLCTYNVEADISRKFPEQTKDFIDFATNAAKDYWKELEYFPGLEPYIIDVWANKTPKGGWVESHLHLSIPLTATLYIDASPEQGNVVFEHPADALLASQPIDYQKRYQFEHEVDVHTGDFLIFPGYLKHRVKKNTIDRPRLIFGLSYGCKGYYWQGNWIDQQTADLSEIIKRRGLAKS
jgi:uncharacterized protein (TIGR02466 family)